eukprot:CAMPEP_0175286766 /NCGR_PEP_ID=MMETSP0093-20121207/53931_1 /TAXON_ID=311494 /ORGANISM="Alexandrium monilatum, Strain CCMP3105" /LENGTH=47 /DNA_ID= /DNA_START= /DNA_END= /DNA_ORIENTATION=
MPMPQPSAFSSSKSTSTLKEDVLPPALPTAHALSRPAPTLECGMRTP